MLATKCLLLLGVACPALALTTAKAVQEPSALETARDAVAEGDADHDGALNKLEFVHAIDHDKGLQGAVFEALDPDHDGKLDAEPFEQNLERRTPTPCDPGGNPPDGHGANPMWTVRCATGFNGNPKQGAVSLYVPMDPTLFTTSPKTGTEKLVPKVEATKPDGDGWVKCGPVAGKCVVIELPTPKCKAEMVAVKNAEQALSECVGDDEDADPDPDLERLDKDHDGLDAEPFVQQLEKTSTVGKALGAVGGLAGKALGGLTAGAAAVRSSLSSSTPALGAPCDPGGMPPAGAKPNPMWTKRCATGFSNVKQGPVSLYMPWAGGREMIYPTSPKTGTDKLVPKIEGTKTGWSYKCGPFNGECVVTDFPTPTCHDEEEKATKAQDALADCRGFK